jgi:hypothetical protein
VVRVVLLCSFSCARTDGGNREAKNVFVYGNSTDDGMLSSDHRLVVADVELP